MEVVLAAVGLWLLAACALAWVIGHAAAYAGRLWAEAREREDGDRQFEEVGEDWRWPQAERPINVIAPAARTRPGA